MQLRRRSDEGCVGCGQQQNCAETSHERRHPSLRHGHSLGIKFFGNSAALRMAGAVPAASAPAALDEASTAAPAAFART